MGFYVSNWRKIEKRVMMFADFGDHPASKMHEFNVKLLLLDLSAVFMISCYIYMAGNLKLSWRMYWGQELEGNTWTVTY